MGRWAQARRRGSAANANLGPPIPSNIVLIGDIFTPFDLTWDSSSDPTSSWDVELRDVTGGLPGTLLESASLAPAVRQWFPSTAPAFTTEYDCRIRSNNGGGNVSAWFTSNTVP